MNTQQVFATNFNLVYRSDIQLIWIFVFVASLINWKYLSMFTIMTFIFVIASSRFVTCDHCSGYRATTYKHLEEIYHCDGYFIYYISSWEVYTAFVCIVEEKTNVEKLYICLQFPDEFEQRDMASLPPGLRAPAPMML